MNILSVFFYKKNKGRRSAGWIIAQLYIHNFINKHPVGNQMKRLLSIFLCVTMVATSVVPVSAESTFSDVEGFDEFISQDIGTPLQMFAKMTGSQIM